MNNDRFNPMQDQGYGESFYFEALWRWFSDSIAGSGSPIKNWWRFPIQPQASLNLSGRPELGVNRGFFEEFKANNLEEALDKYAEVIKTEGLTSCPLIYRFHYLDENGRPFMSHAGAFLSQTEGPWDHNCRCFSHPWEDYVQEVETNTLFVLTSEDAETGEWDEYECEERGLVRERALEYEPYLAVGGENEEQAEARWTELAAYLRNRLLDKTE